MNPERADEARRIVARLIELIGDDPSRPGLLETPDRVVRSWSELYSGYEDDGLAYAKVFESNYDQVVLLRGVRYFSTCEHHLLPFFGHAHVAYVPQDGKVLGVSKLSRIVNSRSRRLQIQERLTSEIAEEVGRAVAPAGVAVVLRGLHMCMVARGVMQDEATMVTSEMRGLFREDAKARAEVLALMRGETS
jgi:GTP cyclohydrolase I